MNEKYLVVTISSQKLEKKGIITIFVHFFDPRRKFSSPVSNKHSWKIVALLNFHSKPFYDNYHLVMRVNKATSHYAYGALYPKCSANPITVRPIWKQLFAIAQWPGGAHY